MPCEKISELAILGSNQGWQRGPSAQQEGYGTSAVLPDQGIYLAASVYRPVVQVSSMYVFLSSM